MQSQGAMGAAMTNCRINRTSNTAAAAAAFSFFIWKILNMYKVQKKYVIKPHAASITIATQPVLFLLRLLLNPCYFDRKPSLIHK